jgi:D-alanine-D-alanine ligase
MNGKTRIAIIFGGRSAEHEISLLSAANILQAIDKDKYEIFLIGVDRQGRWYLNQEAHNLLEDNVYHMPLLVEESDEVALVPGQGGAQLFNITKYIGLGALDVVFPVMHGSYGEDGSVQGLLRLANIPFVGGSVLGSAVCMDKDVTKRLLRDADIPVVPWLTFVRNEKAEIKPDIIEDILGMPVFVKPANLGSSVGVSRVAVPGDLAPAIELAFSYDNKVLIEQYVRGRELECSVLGNEDPVVSVVGEVISHHEFYSYEAKYVDEKGAILDIPARIRKEQSEAVKRYALRAFKALCCEGMARVDFFLLDNGEIIVNEINTIPGFTKMSMYPKLWECSGIAYSELIDRLVSLALDRFQKDSVLITEVSEERDTLDHSSE